MRRMLAVAVVGLFALSACGANETGAEGEDTEASTTTAVELTWGDLGVGCDSNGRCSQSDHGFASSFTWEESTDKVRYTLQEGAGMRELLNAIGTMHAIPTRVLDDMAATTMLDGRKSEGDYSWSMSDGSVFMSLLIDIYW